MYPSRFYRIKKFFLNFFFRKKFILKKNINFGSKKANFYFTNNLKKSKFYFEYGSGSSTFLAKWMLRMCGSVNSVELRTRSK